MDNVLRIAVADDEPEMLQFLEMALSSMGHKVVIQAQNGQELIDACRATLPDLIITDINMPEVDGLEAVKQIQGTGLVPVILVSAHHDPEFIQRAIQNHVLSYLVKPIKKKDLEPAISREVIEDAVGLPPVRTVVEVEEGNVHDRSIELCPAEEHGVDGDDHRRQAHQERPDGRVEQDPCGDGDSGR